MSNDGMDPAALNVTPDFSEKIEVPKLAVQIVFDALCQSMDFGSGFLDTEDVHGLREIATALGVDPNEATPDDFRKDFPHPFKMPTAPYIFGERPRTINTIDEGRMPDYMPCMVGTWSRSCNRSASDPIHSPSA
jgi:hypothetical protein